MNAYQTSKLRITRLGGFWVITDPKNPHVTGITVDAAVVNTTHRGDDFVEGFIASVHGLDMETAQHLNRHQLSALGIGSHLRAHAAPPQHRGLGKVFLGADGQMTGGRQ